MDQHGASRRRAPRLWFLPTSPFTVTPSLSAAVLHFRFINAGGRAIRFLLIGHGGGINQGQHLVSESYHAPLTNLWFARLRHVGVDTLRLADSDGVLPGATA